jgi:hypothetical protein
MIDSIEKPSFFIALAGVITLVATAGCGDSGPPRLEVWGDINWNGSPVPNGVIYFDPDVMKGNSGPQGFTVIVNGKYDTRAANSKGCVSGPHVAEIHGYDAQEISQFRPYGNKLFVPQKLPVTIPADGGQLDFTVPPAAPPVPKTGQPAL